MVMRYTLLQVFEKLNQEVKKLPFITKVIIVLSFLLATIWIVFSEISRLESLDPSVVLRPLKNVEVLTDFLIKNLALDDSW